MITIEQKSCKMQISIKFEEKQKEFLKWKL